MVGKISNMTRIILVVSALGLSLVFIFPLWSIDLWAPQYPEGLGIKIWLNKITGDLDNINLLNHYIGMQRIEPDSIPELKIFVYLFSALLALVLLVSMTGKRILLYIYTVLFLVFSFGALYDFWSWEYKYGHELNPDAAIKIEGETYQPPLFGTKELANIEATSWPALGGIGHIVALSLTLAACALDLKNNIRRVP